MPKESMNWYQLRMIWPDSPEIIVTKQHASDEDANNWANLCADICGKNAFGTKCTEFFWKRLGNSDVAEATQKVTIELTIPMPEYFAVPSHYNEENAINVAYAILKGDADMPETALIFRCGDRVVQIPDPQALGQPKP